MSMVWRRWKAPAAALSRWRNEIMFMRQLMMAALVSTILVCAGCHCGCKRPCAYGPPCCGPAVPAGPAVAVPAAPAPVTANCPTCVGGP